MAHGELWRAWFRFVAHLEMTVNEANESIVWHVHVVVLLAQGVEHRNALWHDGLEEGEVGEASLVFCV